MKSLVILLYGYPSSGKTRAAEAIRELVMRKDRTAYEAPGPLPTVVTSTILNVDTIRHVVNGGVWYDVHTESQVMRHAYVATRALLATNDVVIVDEAMLMTTEWDRYFTQKFGGVTEDFDVLRAHVATDMSTAFWRNSLRERVVPKSAYDDMWVRRHTHKEDVRLTIHQDSVVFEF